MTWWNRTTEEDQESFKQIRRELFCKHEYITEQDDENVQILYCPKCGSKPHHFK